jgi:uncharacterized protein (DUF1499 family)
MLGITAIGTVSVAYVMSLMAAGLFALSVMLLRGAFIDYKLPLLIILIGTLIAMAAFVLTLGALALGQISQLNMQRVAIALILSAVIFTPVVLAGRALSGVPLINDIMTDTQNPPQFTVVPTQRKSFDNSLELSKERLAFHNKHYSHIKPLRLSGGADSHFDHVVELVGERGWTLVAANRAKGVVEATESTVFFGFKDDVVIRLSEENGETRIDMRSASRQGRSDFRVNAQRITAFFEDLKDD